LKGIAGNGNFLRFFCGLAIGELAKLMSFSELKPWILIDRMTHSVLFLGCRFLGLKGFSATDVREGGQFEVFM
jgi:hypothetical protein